jgi:hypothetical protein
MATKSAFHASVIRGSEESVRIGALRDQFLAIRKDMQFRRLFAEDISALMDKLPNRKPWNYNTNLMAPIRGDIDSLNKRFINQYCSREFGEFSELLDVQQKKFAEAFGGSRNEYKENKIKDLYARLGNILLKELSSPSSPVAMAAAVQIRQRGIRAAKVSAAGVLQPPINMYAMRRLFVRSIDSMKNQAAYSRMVNELER